MVAVIHTGRTLTEQLLTIIMSQKLTEKMAECILAANYPKESGGFELLSKVKPA